MARPLFLIVYHRSQKAGTIALVAAISASMLAQGLHSYYGEVYTMLDVQGLHDYGDDTNMCVGTYSIRMGAAVAASLLLG